MGDEVLVKPLGGVNNRPDMPPSLMPLYSTHRFWSGHTILMGAPSFLATQTVCRVTPSGPPRTPMPAALSRRIRPYRNLE